MKVEMELMKYLARHNGICGSEIKKVDEHDGLIEITSQEEGSSIIRHTVVKRTDGIINKFVTVMDGEY